MSLIPDRRTNGLLVYGMGQVYRVFGHRHPTCAGVHATVIKPTFVMVVVQSPETYWDLYTNHVTALVVTVGFLKQLSFPVLLHWPR